MNVEANNQSVIPFNKSDQPSVSKGVQGDSQLALFQGGTVGEIFELMKFNSKEVQLVEESIERYLSCKSEDLNWISEKSDQLETIKKTIDLRNKKKSEILELGSREAQCTQQLTQCTTERKAVDQLKEAETKTHTSKAQELDDRLGELHKIRDAGGRIALVSFSNPLTHPAAKKVARALQGLGIAGLPASLAFHPEGVKAGCTPVAQQMMTQQCGGAVAESVSENSFIVSAGIAVTGQWAYSKACAHEEVRENIAIVSKKQVEENSRHQQKTDAFKERGDQNNQVESDNQVELKRSQQERSEAENTKGLLEDRISQVRTKVFQDTAKRSFEGLQECEAQLSNPDFPEAAKGFIVSTGNKHVKNLFDSMAQVWTEVNISSSNLLLEEERQEKLLS